MVERANRKYAVSIRYLRKEGDDFDFERSAGTHMPLGIATFRRVNGISPVRAMAQHETFGWMENRSQRTAR